MRVSLGNLLMIVVGHEFIYIVHFTSFQPPPVTATDRPTPIFHRPTATTHRKLFPKRSFSMLNPSPLTNKEELSVYLLVLHSQYFVDSSDDKFITQCQVTSLDPIRE